ncbi:hypothetical protein V9J87_004238 [Escherichia coli]
MLGGADNPNGELPSYITGADRSEENALAMLAMTAFTLMTRRGICEMQNVAPDGKGIRLELIGFRGNETIPDTLH